MRARNRHSIVLDESPLVGGAAVAIIVVLRITYVKVVEFEISDKRFFTRPPNLVAVVVMGHPVQ